MKSPDNKKPLVKKKYDVPEDEVEKQEIFSDEVEELETPSDSIEIEIEEGERITYGSSFSYQDGDLGDESEDVLDLPEELKKVGHRYDPTLSVGQPDPEDYDELELGIDIVDSDEAGLGYGDNDYTEEGPEEEEYEEL